MGGIDIEGMKAEMVASFKASLDKVVERHMPAVTSAILATHIALVNSSIEASMRVATALQKQVEETQKESHLKYEVIVESNMQHRREMDLIQEMLREVKCGKAEPDTKWTKTLVAGTGSSGKGPNSANESQAHGQAASTTHAQQSTASGRCYARRSRRKRTTKRSVRTWWGSRTDSTASTY